MRTTVIAAQITTVEDKIAGDLSLTQIFILMIPVFWTTIVYSIFLPRMRLVIYKLPLMIIVLFVCLILSLRIKGKVVLDWLIVIFRYNLRPKYYLLNKNDTYLRTIDLPHFDKKPIKFFKVKTYKKEVKEKLNKLGIEDFIKFDNFIRNPRYAISYKSGRRGGINVAFEKIEK